MISERARGLGFDEGRLANVGRAIETDINNELYDGAALCVSRGGEVAAFEALGYAGRASRREMRDDSVFFSMSVAKQLTVTIVLNRVERGLLSLTGRVADVIPEFGCRGKENITLYQLLTHTAGLMFGPPAVDVTEIGNLDAVVAATCSAPIELEPGKQVSYAAIVAHAIMADDLFAPLGMNDTAFGRREDLAPRMCPVVARDQRPGLFDPELLEGVAATIGADSEIPAGGCLTTAGDLNIFANMLRNGGGPTNLRRPRRGLQHVLGRPGARPDLRLPLDRPPRGVLQRRPPSAHLGSGAGFGHRLRIRLHRPVIAERLPLACDVTMEAKRCDTAEI